MYTLCENNITLSPIRRKTLFSSCFNERVIYRRRRQGREYRMYRMIQKS